MYSRLRRYPEAEKAMAKAMELSTKQEEKDYANFIAGSIYERQKKYDEAESYFRKVLASDPRTQPRSTTSAICWPTAARASMRRSR